MLTGNEMTIKYNELYHLTTEMNDAGAIYKTTRCAETRLRITIYMT